MLWTSWIGVAVGVVMAGATSHGPPPVILDLGPVQATPVPTAKPAARQRLISTITVQNSPKGETVVSFEATDVGAEGNDKFHTIASQRYFLAEEKPELRQLNDKIMQQIRDLERTMLDYVKQAGPPKARSPIDPGQPASGRR